MSFNKVIKWIGVVLFIPLFSCTMNSIDSDLEVGDIIFRYSGNSDLSGAIDNVTQTEKNTHYSHIGMVTDIKNEIIVIHSEPDNGVVEMTLDNFIKADQKVDVYRLIKDSNHTVEQAIKNARKLIGQSYDYTYILESEGYYCSEFIYEIFKKDSIFELNPMTFINTETKETHQIWIDHYQKMGINIPEGLPGCNPNAMAASDKIRFVKQISK